MSNANKLIEQVCEGVTEARTYDAADKKLINVAKKMGAKYDAAGDSFGPFKSEADALKFVDAVRKSGAWIDFDEDPIKSKGKWTVMAMIGSED